MAWALHDGQRSRRPDGRDEGDSVDRDVSPGTVVAALALLVLVIVGVWLMSQSREKQAALDRRAVILRGAGGEHPPPGH